MTEAVQNLLGVDCRSFKQISMIAQGEFMKLLTADSQSRAKIIRNVFHTEALVSLQKRIKAEYLAWNRKCEDASTPAILAVPNLSRGAPAPIAALAPASRG